MNPETINLLDLYRFPWTIPDNGISWLEPTARCNLHCDGCPDITVWKDKNGKDQLVWSCRLEEPMQYFVIVVLKS